MYGLYRQCTSFLGASSRSCGSLKACFYLWKNACLPRLPPPRRRRRSSVRFTRLRRRRYDKSRLLSLSSPFPGFKPYPANLMRFTRNRQFSLKCLRKVGSLLCRAALGLSNLTLNYAIHFAQLSSCSFGFPVSSHTFLLTGPPHSHFLFLTQDRAFPALPRVSPPLPSHPPSSSCSRSPRMAPFKGTAKLHEAACPLRALDVVAVKERELALWRG